MNRKFIVPIIAVMSAGFVVPVVGCGGGEVKVVAPPPPEVKVDIPPPPPPPPRAGPTGPACPAAAR